MRVVTISDLHGRLPKVPECDVLVIAGDFCQDFTRFFDADIMRMRQMEWLSDRFAPWEHLVPAKHILVTPGNHDWVNSLPKGCRSRLLIDEGCTIDGHTFYGTPWTPPFLSWNYLMPRELRKHMFADIPEGLDVLISHGPPHKVLDRNYEGEALGCPELRQAIQRAKPKWCVFGHIHEGQRDGGPVMTLGATECVNVAMWGREWQPFSFDLP